MKKILMAMVAAAGAFLLSAEMPRSEWHAKVGDCAQDPNMLKETISQLSSADKTAFLAEVNAAIDKMPGSTDVKAAKFLAANRAAVAGAGAADRADVLAEVYATVPPEALTVINEEFAKNEFARPATMTEDEFTNIVAQTMTKITQRTASAESGAVRAGFAGLMFIRAAGTSTDAITDAVVSSLPADVQGDARNSWFPAALSDTPSYDPILAPAQAGDEPSPQVVLAIAPPQKVDSMLVDLQAGKTDPGDNTRSPSTGIPGATDPASASDPQNNSLSGVPRDRVQDPQSSYYKGKNRGSGTGESGSTSEPSDESEPTTEPDTYEGQII